MVGRNINISNRNRVSGRDRLQVFLEGFTAIIDLAFGPDGSFYVLQFATGPGLSGPGALIRVAPDGTRTIIASEGLFNPTSVVLGRPDDDDGESDDDGDEARSMKPTVVTMSVTVVSCSTFRTAARVRARARSSGSSALVASLD
ncbi:MAG TPA: hypothetical protein VGQ10_15635 [Vicinamibacterales bacterium]|jgi:hypothetical protein|nr:hypothetical protein [Vicinamibacterales bacterium]